MNVREEVHMKHKVQIGNDNKIHDLKKDLFEEGEIVSFTVMQPRDASCKVTSEQVKITFEKVDEKDKGYYSFIMPNQDVKVDIRIRSDMMALPVSKPNQEKECKNCHKMIDKTMKYCPNCGEKLN